jgi:hypothetical protein
MGSSAWMKVKKAIYNLLANSLLLAASLKTNGLLYEDDDIFY